MDYRYEVMIMGETIDDTDAMFSFLIHADSEAAAVCKAEAIMETVLIHSCSVAEVFRL